MQYILKFELCVWEVLGSHILGSILVVRVREGKGGGNVVSFSRPPLLRQICVIGLLHLKYGTRGES